MGTPFFVDMILKNKIKVAGSMIGILMSNEKN